MTVAPASTVKINLNFGALGQRNSAAASSVECKYELLCIK